RHSSHGLPGDCRSSWSLAESGAMTLGRLAFVALLTVVILTVPLAAEAEDYAYPYRDPYVATVTTAILNADRLRPRLKREILHVPALPGRNRLPGLQGRGRSEERRAGKEGRAG